MFRWNRRRHAALSPRQSSLPSAVAFIERVALRSDAAPVNRDLLVRAASARQSRHGIHASTA
jgi:hypothetical protein